MNRSTYFLLFILLLAGTASAATTNITPLPQTNRPQLVYIGVSQTCTCVLQKCRETETFLSSIRSNTNFKSLEIMTFDYLSQGIDAERYMRDYGLGLFPNLALIAPDRSLILKGSYHIDQSLFLKEIKRICQTQESNH